MFLHEFENYIGAKIIHDPLNNKKIYELVYSNKPIKNIVPFDEFYGILYKHLRKKNIVMIKMLKLFYGILLLKNYFEIFLW